MTGPVRSGGGSNETWTVLRIIRWTTEFLASKGVDTPRLDAEVLLAHLLGLNRVQLYLNFDRPLTADELTGFRERVKRRAAREPAAYIVGRKEFYSLDLEVNPGVLIPRPETELLVDEAVRIAKRFGLSEDLDLADVGTGSGAVAIALASELPPARIWAVDVSEAALEIARKNAEKHGLADRIRFRLGDLLEPLSESGRPFQVIAANLPYVPTPAFADMEPEVRDYEPHTALDGGPDGLSLIRRAIEQAPDYLAPGGALLLEMWPTHADAIGELADRHGFARYRVIPDLAGRNRIGVLEMKGEG